MNKILKWLIVGVPSAIIAIICQELTDKAAKDEIKELYLEDKGNDGEH